MSKKMTYLFRTESGYIPLDELTEEVTITASGIVISGADGDVPATGVPVAEITSVEYWAGVLEEEEAGIAWYRSRYARTVTRFFKQIGE